MSFGECSYLVRRGASYYCNMQGREIRWYDPEFDRYCTSGNEEDCPYNSSFYTGYDSGECPHRTERELTTYCTEINEFVYDDYYCKHSCKSCSHYLGASTGCFITTACVQYKGLTDDCKELQTLRKFRDTYLQRFDEGREDVKNYYKLAPKIVEKINSCENAAEIYDEIYRELVVVCVKFIEDENYAQAHFLYKEYVFGLYEKFLKE